MDKQKQQVKRMIKNMESESITLRKFLLSYYGITSEKFERLKVSHEDLKTLMPHIKRVSFEYLVKNVELLYTGEIILVKDSFNNVAPYLKPEEICVVEEMPFNYENNASKALEDIMISQNLNTHELSLLCREYRRLNRYDEYRTAHRLLQMKKGNGKQYKKKKLELRWKEREKND